MKTVLIAAFDTGIEPEALRQTLEHFGYLVVRKNIGRPADLMDILGGALPLEPDLLVLSCHGESGGIVMPELGEAVYREDEPRGNFGAAETARYLHLSGKVILNLGCTTGQEPLADVFSACNTYIAPTDYVEGSSALLFAIRFFYELAQNGKTVPEAWEAARSTDAETGLFILR